MMSLVSDVSELIYPRQCVCCSDPVSVSEDPICYGCRQDLPILFPKPYQDNEFLMKRFAGLLPLRNAIGFLRFTKGGSTQRLLHGLKYGKRPEVGIVLGHILAEEMRSKGFGAPIDLILPIPLHRKKLKKRGYNQAMKIAEGLAAGFGTNASDQILIRTTASESQTKKGRLQRILNVGEVFGLHPQLKSEMAGKHILLVDDVITTGSTIEACAKLIIEEPIASLSIAALALA